MINALKINCGLLPDRLGRTGDVTSPADGADDWIDWSISNDEFLVMVRSSDEAVTIVPFFVVTTSGVFSCGNPLFTILYGVFTITISAFRLVDE